MTFDEYMRMVEDGNFPEDPRVPVGTSFKNESGSIENIAFGKFGGLAFISTDPMKIRSNHYHKTDYHFLQVVWGSVHYYWRPVGSREAPKMQIFECEDVFFTPPMVEHAVFIPPGGGAEMLSLSRLSRRHSDHEADLVRVQLIKLEDDKVVTCP